MSRIITALWGVTTLLFMCVSAQAATSLDGATLVNEVTIAASGGHPYQITQPGSYRLSSNLTVPGSLNAILIQASGVTLDLGGFSITESGSGGFTIWDEGIIHAGNSVRNGSITGWEAAIFLKSCSDCTVQQLILGNNFDAITVGVGGLVSANVLGFGIVAALKTDPEGITVAGNSVVSGNTISGFASGLELGPNTLVGGNIITGNGVGISFDDPANVVGNFLGGNGKDFSGNTSSDNMFNNNPNS